MGTYTFNTTYMDVRCGSMEIHLESAFPANSLSAIWTSIDKTGSISSALPVILIDLWGRWNESFAKQPDGTYLNPDYTTREGPLEIDGATSGSIRIPCDVTNPPVEIRVQCSETSCVAKAVRYIPPGVGKQLVHPLADNDFTAGFFNNLLLSYGTEQLLCLGNVIEQIISPTRAILSAMQKKSNMTDGIQTMSKRLMLYMNTYYNLDFPTVLGEEQSSLETGWDFVDIHGSFYDPHYALHLGWIAVSYASGIILVIAAIISFWLRRRTMAPDIFGYVSSLTRDNPHLSVAEKGSTLSGIDRARYLKDMKIKISDVNGQNGEVGKIGVTIVRDTVDVGPLLKERKYV